MSPLFEHPSNIDRETVLDITVNVIPMGILAFFVVFFLVYNPFGWDPAMVLLMHALTVIPFVLLGLLTYVAARVISRDERHPESPESADRETAEADEA